MLDTKNAAKWPLTTQNGFDGKKLVVKGHFTLWGSPRWQYEPMPDSASDTNGRSARQDVAEWLIFILGTARFVIAEKYIFDCVPMGALFVLISALKSLPLEGKVARRSRDGWGINAVRFYGRASDGKTEGYPLRFYFFWMANRTQPKYLRCFKNLSRLSP